MIEIAIIGGGKSGTSVLRAFSANEEFKIVGIYDIKEDAPGLKLARQKGIPVFYDLNEMINQTVFNIIIETTGNKNLNEIINNNKIKGTTVIESDMANILVTLNETHNKADKKANSGKKAFQKIAHIIIHTYGEDGAAFFTTDREKYDFIEIHNLELPGLHLGSKLVPGGGGS